MRKENGLIKVGTAFVILFAALVFPVQAASANEVGAQARAERPWTWSRWHQSKMSCLAEETRMGGWVKQRCGYYTTPGWPPGFYFSYYTR